MLAVVLLSLSACSHGPSDAELRQKSDTEIASFDRGAVDSRLSATLKSLEALDAQLEAAYARRDSLQVQASTDVNKQNAVDGTEAEIAAIQQKRSKLLHEQHALEARLRELEN